MIPPERADGLSRSRFRRELLTWLVVAAVYIAVGKIGLALALVNPSATAVWPPTGVAVATILIFGAKAWPGIFLGAFFVNGTTTGSIATSLAIAAGNTLEALAAGYLVNRFAGGHSAFNRGTGIFLFVLLAGLLSSAISATIGVTALSLGRFAQWSEYGSIWLTWWLGDAMGAIIVAPVLLSWATERHLARLRPRLAELSLAVIALVGVGWMVFVSTHLPVGFLTLPVCIWIAFRFGQREAVTATCVLSILATWATVHGYGSFAVAQSPNTGLLLLQTFMAVNTLVGLSVGTAVQERVRAEEHIRRINQDLERRVAERTAALRAAHDGLLTSESRFAEAQEVGHIGSWEWNLADNREWWSDQLFRICGFEPGSFSPGLEKFFELVPPKDRDRVRGLIREASRGQHPFAFEHLIIRPDGHVRRLSAHGRAVTDGHGHPIRILGTAQDITDQKAAEDFLKRSEQRLKTIIDAEPACVKLVSPEGLLLEMNPAGLAMLGATDISQVAGQPVVEIVHPDDRDRFLETHRAASAGIPGRLEFRIVGLDGNQLSVDSHLVPFDTAVNGTGAPRSVLSVTSDVTGQRRLEEQLRQAQKLEALGRLVGSIAHDFKNFLTALVGYTELALRQVGDDERVYPDLKNDLKEILNLGRRASALTNQLLIFSRRPTLVPKPLNVDVVVAPLEPMLTQLLGATVRGRIALTSGETRVRIDPSHLEQIVVNLAVNARDAMPHGGEVTIETSVVHIDAPDSPGHSVNPSPGSYVLLAVSDTGSGMDDNVKAHLFEPFFTTKPAGQGTGLGLATVYGIVKQSGGFVFVDSELGRGTSFKIYFPLVPDSLPIDSEPMIAPSTPDDCATVLVVDDDEHVRAVARDVLREHGYRVLEARTGEEASQLSAAYSSSIHIVVTDVVMPGMSGGDLVIRLRRRRPGLRALFMSGYEQQAIAHYRLLDASAVLLKKPFTSQQLLTHVETALAGISATIRTDN